ncbi:MAG: hypothetical protein IPL28_19545 [Chloroflexi bacterium]|nr:hypothetical protein [Chloroflexota bacterium]
MNVQIRAAQAVMEKHPEKAISALQKGAKAPKRAGRGAPIGVGFARHGRRSAPCASNWRLAAETEKRRVTALPTYKYGANHGRSIAKPPHPLPCPQALTNDRKRWLPAKSLPDSDYINLERVRLVVAG